MAPEEIAREAAEALVGIGQRQDTETSFPHAVLVGDYETYHHADVVTAARDAAFIRRQVAAAIQAAIEKALATVPVPGGMDGETLAYVRGISDEMASDVGRFGAQVTVEREKIHLYLAALLEHVEHLTRVLQDCGQDGTAAVWQGGYEAGRAAERDALFAGLQALEPLLTREIYERAAAQAAGRSD